MFCAAARARRGSRWARSSRFWSLVYAWTVIMSPDTIPKASSSTLIIGTKQLVVHEALEMMTWRAGSNSSSLTPTTNVPSTPLAGAVMITRDAPPSRWLAAASRVVNRPVDSTTTDTPSSAHGSRAGSRSAKTRIEREPTTNWSPSTLTGSLRRPWVESYRKRWALVSTEVMSLIATTSTSAPLARTLRRKLRPMRPKPLMPTRTMSLPPLVVYISRSESACANLAGSCTRPLGPERGRSTTGSSRRPRGIPQEVSQSTISTSTPCWCRAATWAATS